VTPKAQPGKVQLGAGEGHRRVQGHHVRTQVPGRLEHGEAVASGGVGDVLPLPDRTRRGEHRDHVGQHVVGDGQEEQVARAADRAGLAHRHTGQQGLDAGAGGVGLAGCRGHLVACSAESCGEHGTDSAGTDDTQVRDLSGHGHLPFVPVPHVGYRTV
jgi:hypothetical protein